LTIFSFNKNRTSNHFLFWSFKILSTKATDSPEHTKLMFKKPCSVAPPTSICSYFCNSSSDKN
jgi:hypothetical protein